ILFDPEEGMPEHIAHPATAKDHGSQQGEVITWRERLLPRPSPCSLVHEGPDEGAGHGQKPGVEGGMPGGKKGRLGFPMGVRPADYPGRQRRHDPVKPATRRHGLTTLCRSLTHSFSFLMCSGLQWILAQV